MTGESTKDSRGVLLVDLLSNSQGDLKRHLRENLLRDLIANLLMDLLGDLLGIHEDIY